ncbi:nucleotidyltransferase domain protein [bacterium BMS3Abin03]|nr:nucleotidyltransferase domain protein [bacterium BMS3Abin03]
MKLRQEHIERIRNFFRNKPVLKAYLFGSFGRGEADDNSDIDILVELDYSKKIGLEFVQMQLDLKELLQHKVDLLSEKALSKYIRPLIDNDKQLIYEK